MKYSPSEGVITASGNVRFKGPDGEIFGDWGLGAVSDGNFEMRGNVKGFFHNLDGRSLDITCDSIKLQETANGTDKSKNKTITASGGVKLSNAGERLAAETVIWSMGSENYSASGNVVGEFETYSLDADKISRNQETFFAENIRNYTDIKRRITLSAAKAEGVINVGEVVELVADGQVAITMPDSGGAVTKVTGDKGIFSVARGTLVVSGNTTITQAGRNLSSENIVYDLDSGRVDAIGNTVLIFEMQKN
jgi:lipopolysaccharide export system protein LptA